MKVELFCNIWRRTGKIVGAVSMRVVGVKGEIGYYKHFAADIDEEMVALQVPRNVRHMDKAVRFYRSYEALWPYVSRIIGYTELVPEPDETVEETEAPTVIKIVKCEGDELQLEIDGEILVFNK